MSDEPSFLKFDIYPLWGIVRESSGFFTLRWIRTSRAKQQPFFVLFGHFCSILDLWNSFRRQTQFKILPKFYHLFIYSLGVWWLLVHLWSRIFLAAPVFLPRYMFTSRLTYFSAGLYLRSSQYSDNLLP